MPEMKPVISVGMSPDKAGTEGQTFEETFRSLNRLPLFMTELDETDGEGGDNIALEAIRALAHEGTPVEVAQNFKEQGDGFAKVRAWKDAKGCYDQALTALKTPKEPDEGDRSDKVSTNAEAAHEEDVRERQIEEKCFVNRALCNLKLRMLISHMQA